MSSDQNIETLPAGHRLLWYEIVRVLGKGGFGVTYLGKDTNLDQLVAIKEYLPAGFASRRGSQGIVPNRPEDKETFDWGLDRFLKEAQILARLKHISIVRVLSFFRDSNTAYMVMEYEEGESMESVLKRRTVLPEVELERLLPPLLSGLEVLHAAGYIHRDIKPANIFIRTDGSPVLLDFGAARQAVAGHRGSGEMTSLLSLGYSPFEQYDASGARQGPWSDIYAMGGVVYRSVTGQKPIDAAMRISAKLRNEPDPMRPAVEAAKGRFLPGFLAAIDKALQVIETDRPQSIQAWRPLLLGALGNNPPPVARPVEREAEPVAVPVPPPVAAAPITAPPGQEALQKKKSTWRSFISSLNEFGTQIGPAERAQAQPQTRSRPPEPVNGGSLPRGDTFLEAGSTGTPLAAALDAAIDPVPVQLKLGDVWQDRITGMEFLWIPGSKYWMGSPKGERGRREDESPIHMVELEGFWMAKHPVTWFQWKRVMGDPKGLYHPSKATYPVERVLWEDTQNYIRALMRMVGSGVRFRLPTEAEWEFAARAGTSTAYYFGDDPALLGQHAWYADNSGGHTQPVGLKPPSPWGLYDMLGNVWEWTEDWYGEDYYSISPAKNPRGAPFGDTRVRRGGSWRSNYYACRIAHRNRVAVQANSNALGFRLIRVELNRDGEEVI